MEEPVPLEIDDAVAYGRIVAGVSAEMNVDDIPTRIEIDLRKRE